jgi:hypothetical protein
LQRSPNLFLLAPRWDRRVTGNVPCPIFGCGQRFWLRESKVVIAAHSQGSIIAAAALLINAAPADESSSVPTQLPLMSWPVALLTFGSPLRRLYARNFPAYLGFDTLKLLEAQARDDSAESSLWVNLWALTDPIGAWIFNEDLGDRSTDTPTGPSVDRRLLDARALEPVEGRYPPICAHPGFWTRREYWQALNTLATRIVMTRLPTPVRHRHLFCC